MRTLSFFAAPSDWHKGHVASFHPATNVIGIGRGHRHQHPCGELRNDDPGGQETVAAILATIESAQS